MQHSSCQNGIAASLVHERSQLNAFDRCCMSLGSGESGYACRCELRRITLLGRSRGEEGSSDHRVEPPTPTLKLIVRERVRTLDLASGQPECSLVSLRAGPITHAAPRVPRGGTKVPKVVAHGGPALDRYSTLKLWRRASLERLFSARSRTLRSGEPPLLMSGWSRAQARETPGRLGGGDTGAPGPTPKIVPLCNTLNNPRTCREWAFSSRRACALIPAGGEWETLGWWRPPSYEGRRGLLALRHT